MKCLQSLQIWSFSYVWALLALSTTLSASPQNATDPCRNPHFKPPIYHFDDFRYRKQWLGYLNGAANFTLRDIANNYNFSCGTKELMGQWNFITKDDYDFHWCDPEGLLSLDVGFPHFRYRYMHGFNVLQTSFEWFCYKPHGRYPRVILARDELNFTQPPDCPGFTKEYPADGIRKVYDSWTISDSQPRNFPIPPSPSTSVSSHSAIPNSNEAPCVGRSFTYPGWYIDTAGPVSLETDLDVTVRHKTTSYTVRCIAAASHDPGRNLTCSPERVAQVRPGLLGVPKFSAEFDRKMREIQISQAWTCVGNDQEQK